MPRTRASPLGYFFITAPASSTEKSRPVSQDEIGLMAASGDADNSVFTIGSSIRVYLRSPHRTAPRRFPGRLLKMIGVKP